MQLQPRPPSKRLDNHIICPELQKAMQFWQTHHDVLRICREKEEPPPPWGVGSLPAALSARGLFPQPAAPSQAPPGIGVGPGTYRAGRGWGALLLGVRRPSQCDGENHEVILSPVCASTAAVTKDRHRSASNRIPSRAGWRWNVCRGLTGQGSGGRGGRGGVLSGGSGQNLVLCLFQLLFLQGPCDSFGPIQRVAPAISSSLT